MKTKGSTIGKRRSAASRDSTASYQSRRDEITRAAIRVFHEKGFESASLSAVAAELDVDRATIYYYFSSKEQLFDETVKTVLEGNLEVSRQIADSQSSPPQKLRNLISALMIGYDASYPLLYIYIREDLRRIEGKRSGWSARMLELNRVIERTMIDIINEGYTKGSFQRIGPAKIVAYGILGSLNWTHRWYKPSPNASSAADIGSIFSDLMISGLQKV